MNMDKEALAKIEKLRAERDYYKSIADTLQATLEENEAALRVAKAQLAQIINDRRYEVG